MLRRTFLKLLGALGVGAVAPKPVTLQAKALPIAGMPGTATTKPTFEYASDKLGRVSIREWVSSAPLIRRFELKAPGTGTPQQLLTMPGVPRIGSRHRRRGLPTLRAYQINAYRIEGDQYAFEVRYK